MRRTERGAALIKHCRGILDRAERRVAALMIDGDGKVKAGGDVELEDDVEA